MWTKLLKIDEKTYKMDFIENMDKNEPILGDKLFFFLINELAHLHELAHSIVVHVPTAFGTFNVS